LAPPPGERVGWLPPPWGRVLIDRAGTGFQARGGSFLRSGRSIFTAIWETKDFLQGPPLGRKSGGRGPVGDLFLAGGALIWRGGNIFGAVRSPLRARWFVPVGGFMGASKPPRFHWKAWRGQFKGGPFPWGRVSPILRCSLFGAGRPWASGVGFGRANMVKKRTGKHSHGWLTATRTTIGFFETVVGKNTLGVR